MVVSVTNARASQGCTKALLGAITLNSLLRREKEGLSPGFLFRFFKEQAKKIHGFW
jgi:hypothetical protein